MLSTYGALAVFVAAGAAIYPPPSSSSPVPSPTPTPTFAPFRDECFNKCVPGRNTSFTDMDSFCRSAKDDYQLYYCIMKMCYTNEVVFKAAIDEACANPPDHLHPFKNECANQCVDQQPGKYKDMKYFCATARTDTTLRNCYDHRCNEWWYDYRIDEVCGPVSVTSTPSSTPSSTPYSTPPPSTTPPPSSLSSSSSHFPCWNKTLCSRPPHSTGSHGPITITETSTHIETLTYCPHRHTCTGQTTTWTFTEGPTSCPPTTTCTCVLPGYTTLTVCPPSVTCSGQTTTNTEGVTVVLPSETIPTVKATPTTTGVTEFQGKAAKAGAGLVAALAGVVAVL